MSADRMEAAATLTFVIGSEGAVPRDSSRAEGLVLFVS
jgi:hypothetical protein